MPFMDTQNDKLTFLKNYVCSSNFLYHCLGVVFVYKDFSLDDTPILSTCFF